MKFALVLSLIFIVSAFAVEIPKEKCPQKKVVFCYYGSWATYRLSTAAHPVSQIDPDLCTHLVYTFAGLDVGEMVIKSLDEYNDLSENNGKGSYRKFTKLKEDNPCLTTLLAIGGWNEGSINYSIMSQSKRDRATFVESVVEFLNRFDFDGLDFDWEYPTLRGGVPEDRENFVKLLDELKVKLSEEGKLLTMAAGATHGDDVYDMKSIAKIVDFVQLMTYDYAIPTENSLTDYHTALSSVKKSVDNWLKAGFPKEKLVVGLAFYGRSYTLVNSEKHGIGAPAKGPGQAGRFTQEPGMLAYYEILAKIDEGDYIIEKNDEEATMYATYGTQWFTYDNEEMIAKKVKYVLDNDLAGLMIWAIDLDDFRALYSDVERPLLQTINDILT